MTDIDYISREDARQSILKTMNSWGASDCRSALWMANDRILQIPAAKVVPTEPAEWVRQPYLDEYGLTCSNCEFVDIHFSRSNFCPVCGRPMMKE